MSQEENKLSDRALAKKLGALAAHFEAACYVGDTYMVEENAADALVLRQAEAALSRRASAGGKAVKPKISVADADVLGIPVEIAQRVIDRYWAVNTYAAPSPSPAPVVEWGDAETVGNCIAQLQTFDPATPIYGAFHAEVGGKRQPMVRGLTLSRERVNGRKIETGNEEVPYSIVAWTASAEPALPKAVPDVSEEQVQRLKAAFIAETGATIWPTDQQFRAILSAAQGVE